MNMSRIHALQSSASSHKLLESVRSLRPLLCEALRASGCDTIDINEQDLAVDGETLQNEVVHLNSDASGHHHDVYTQAPHVEELSNRHSTISSYHGHIHDHDVNVEYPGHTHVDLLVQRRNPWHVAPQLHTDSDAGHPFVDIEHHNYVQYQDAHNHEYGKYGNTEYEHYGNVYPKEFEHHGDAFHHAYWNHRDAHHNGNGHHGDADDAHHRGYGHENGSNVSSISVNADNSPQIMDFSSELLGMQKCQEQIVQMSFWHSSLMSRESSVNVDPYSSLSCTQYPQADNHILAHQHIHVYHNHHVQQHIPSETMTFMNTILLEAPCSVTNNALIGAEATNKSNNNNEGAQDQNSSRYSLNNFELHEVHAGHQANCREPPPLPKQCKPKKRLPKTTPKQSESSEESEGTDNEEGGKLLGLKGKDTISTANIFSERRRKKWNEALYALRALVPVVTKMDKVSIVGDTITYLQQLRDKVDNLQNDICSLQTEKEELTRSQEGVFTCTSQEMESCQDSPKYKIFELEVYVVDMEQKTYHLSVCCKREDAVLLELTKALETLNLIMLNANIAARNENQILYTVVVKVDTAEVLTPDMLKESILKIATVYGFYL